VTLLVAIWALGISASSICPATARAAAGDGNDTSRGVRIARLTDEVGDLSEKLDSAETSFERLLYPVGILVAILAAGGTLGIVFSFRDQRRTSQLHELTVAGELSAQKRTEQSYGSFLEQSQTTLSLVNDTLKLAKEANDRAMQDAKSKAEAEVEVVDARSRALLNDAFGQEEFSLIIDDDGYRHQLHSIADDARLLQGYLRLQGIKFGRYTKFIKALDQFLTDDTEGAIEALTLSVGEGGVSELQRFEEYWLGYMLTAIGDYSGAIKRFTHDRVGVKEDHPEYFQLSRIIAETEYFLIAKENADKNLDSPPAERQKQVESVLEDLSELTEKLRSSSGDRGREDTDRRRHALLEIARTRADIHEWIAYDRGHLDDSLDESKQAAKSETEKEDLKARTEALEKVREICKGVEKKDRNLDLNFALAECLFKLGEGKKAREAFESASATLNHEFDVQHEKRRSASLHQSLLICQVRLLGLVDKKERKSQKVEVNRALKEAAKELKDMRQPSVTVFSQVQRRNIAQEDFAEELQAIVNKHPLMGTKP
jgi:tetratricopeptide (TPR) repeat protein